MDEGQMLAEAKRLREWLEWPDRSTSLQVYLPELYKMLFLLADLMIARLEPSIDP